MAGVLERTGGRGADAVIVTAAGGDAGLLNKAFEACRRKGRVVLVGDVPIRIQRDKIYKKEIDFLISTSYGPGRYDPAYEEKGQDYPFGYVRWTEGRNLEEVLRQIAAGTLRVKPLIDATHGVEDASAAYAVARVREPPDRHPARLPPRRGSRGATGGLVQADRAARAGAGQGRRVRRRRRRLRWLLPLDAAAAAQGAPGLLAGLGLRPERAHGPRRGRERRLREGHDRLPRARRRPRRRRRLRGDAPRPALSRSRGPRSRPARPSSSRSR